MARVKVTKTFRDAVEDCYRQRGDEFEAADERAQTLVGLGIVEAIPEKKKAAPRRTSAKKQA